MAPLLLALIGAAIRSQGLDKSLALRMFVAEALGEFVVMGDAVSYPWDGHFPSIS